MDTEDRPREQLIEELVALKQKLVSLEAELQGGEPTKVRSALKEWEERFRNIFENTHVGLFRSRVEDGKILDCNDRFAQIVGYPDRASCMEDFFASRHYVDPAKREEMLEEIKNTGEINNFEVQATRRDGSKIWTRYSGRLNREKGYIEGVLTDITEHRHAEHELARERATLKKIINLNPYAISLYDPEGRFMRANQAFYDLWKSSPPPEWSLLSDPILREHGYGDALKDLSRGKVMRVPEIWYNPHLVNSKYPDHPVYVRGLVFPVMDRDGEVEHLVAIHEDFTKKRLAQQKLKSSEERFRLLLSNIPAVVYVGYADWTVDFFDEGIEELTGYEKAQFDSRSLKWSDLVLKDDMKDAKQLFVKALRADGAYVREYRIRHRKGQIIWIQERGKIVLDKADRIKHINGVFYDVSDRRIAAQERKRLESQLLHAQKMEAIGTLAGGIAHDFNNLLQAIQGFGELLLLDREEGDVGFQELLEIVHAAKRGGELSRQLLTFSRKVESKIRPIDLDSHVKRVKKILRRTIPKMITIRLDLAEGAKIVNADPTQVEQVIMNLALNAKDAMPEGGALTVSTRQITLDQEFVKAHVGSVAGDYVLLQISDTGHGMEPETLEHIFDPFYSTKEVGRGTGLGLSMVYGIVKNHGGHITCKSRKNEGTTFSIYLPAFESPEEKGEMEESVEPKRGTETILLVDDEKFIRNLGERTLTRFGYTVLLAVDGESALEIYRGKREGIDLIILDLIMPGMGGGKCLEEFLKIDPRAKVLISSGYSAGEPDPRLKKMGARGFLRKPYDVTSMLGKIREVLDRD